MKRSTRTAALIIPAALAAAVLTAPPAQAKDGDTITRAQCGAISQKLKLSPENGRLEVEYELDQNRNGRTWRVTVARDGTTVATRTRTTQAPSGSFEVRLVTGSGEITVTAVQRGTGTRCRISATG